MNELEFWLYALYTHSFNWENHYMDFQYRKKNSERYAKGRTGALALRPQDSFFPSFFPSFLPSFSSSGGIIAENNVSITVSTAVAVPKADLLTYLFPYLYLSKSLFLSYIISYHSIS